MSILFFLVAFVSEIVGTMVGFGSSTIFLPLALLFVNFKAALVLVAFLHIFGNLGRIAFFKHGIDWNLILKFGTPSVLLAFIGALLVPYISANVLKRSLGVFLVAYSSYSLWKENFAVYPSTRNAIVGGGISGFLAGLIGTGGALRGAFLTGFRLPKERYIATTASIALAVDITRIPLYISQGFLESRYYLYIPILFLVALVGSFAGKQMVKKIPQETFTRIVLLAIFIIGIKFAFDLLS